MSLKDFIIHITSGDPYELKAKLHENQAFRTYFDGFSQIFDGFEKNGVVLSTRFYYYDIPHASLSEMVRLLQSKKVGFSVKVKINASSITGSGNHNFD